MSKIRAIRWLHFLAIFGAGLTVACDDSGNTSDEDTGGGAGGFSADFGGTDMRPQFDTGAGGADAGAGGMGGADAGAGGMGDDMGRGDDAGAGGDDMGRGEDAGAADVGAADVGAADVGAADVGAADVGAGDIGGGEDAGAADMAMPVCVDGALQPCPAEIGCDGGQQTCVAGEWGPCVGPAEMCNQIDDDCDGEIDEEWAIGDDCAIGVGACAAAGTMVCTEDGQGAVCSAEPVEPVAETCDSIDNDCDGSVDEESDEVCYNGPDGTAGVGACVMGVAVCVDGALGACVGAITPDDEVCDNIDNNCDGVIDDGDLSAECYTGPDGTEGVGVCVGGTQTCEAGALGACQNERIPGQEICDNLDNDCDGNIDEDVDGGCECQPGDIRECYTGPEDTLGLGVCRAGTQACQADNTFAPCEGETVPAAEICDGVDNNCNGIVDDQIAGVGEPCMGGVGACAEAGETICNGANAAIVCDAVPGEPGDEVCNEIDDDCDGEIDEELGLGERCSDGLGACETVGVMVCGEEGGVQCDATPGEPAEEICDGIDNDCNGIADDNGDGEPLLDVCYTGPAGTEGVGICAAGQAACVNGELGECIGQVVPGREICNNIDDDCNGVIDNVVGQECLCEPGEVQDCYTGPRGTEGVGQCQAGQQTCLRDGSGFSECGGEVLPDGEQCDGIDNNCSGVIDDVRGVGARCTDGVGACRRGGMQVCDLEVGQLVCNAIPGEPGEEICDGVDNDCDGALDEEIPTVGDACTSGQGICEAAGTLVCVPRQGAVLCNAVEGNPQEEICDRLDNDCDGEVDNTGGPCADLVVGVQQDVPEQEILDRGWRACYAGTYNQGGVDVAEVLAGCEGDDMMIACRPTPQVVDPIRGGNGVNRPNFTLAAEAARADVLFESGNVRGDGGHEANGVHFYYSDGYSWGFGPAGEPVDRFSCDVVRDDSAPLRMCWHTSGGNIQSGYRCGNNSINGDVNWQRVIFVRSAQACGDGNVDAGEECDDGNHIDGDGCDSACMLEASCGNGNLDMGEECDDGNNNDFDGCSAQCTLENPDLIPGIQQNVLVADVLARGYRECFRGLYSDRNIDLNTVLNDCQGDNLMMACSPTNSDTLTLAAEGLYASVIQDVGDAVDAKHLHNGVGWYFSGTRSWGFAPADLPVNRNSCDFGGDSPEQRLCWHTSNNQIQAGYRCGNTFNQGERILYVRDAAPECQDYTLIDDATRNTTFGDDSVTCDRDLEGWYRFGGEAGTQMPTSPPDIRHCGTHAPGWLNGVHPNAADGIVDRQACFNWNDNTCNWSSDIQVRNCGDFFVYNLVNPPACSLRYCAEGAGLDFAGIRQDVPEAELLSGGFEVCHSETYDIGLDEDAMVQACDGDVIALACRQVGSATFDVVAMGEHAEVLTPGANQPAGVHDHNGLQWYFGNNHSIGFFPLGAAINGAPCDVVNGDDRLCWHTQNSGGYRCGAQTGLNNNADWEKVVLQRAGTVAGPPPVVLQ